MNSQAFVYATEYSTGHELKIVLVLAIDMMADWVALLYTMREQKIMVRVGSKEKKLLDEASKAKGLPTSSWGRMELLRAASDCPTGGNGVIRPHTHGLLSLFCGPGGLDEGFRQAGFKTQLAFDCDQECINTFALNHPDAKAQVEDVRLLTLKKLDHYAGCEFKPVGVIGGPPCQSFSVSNVHQTEDDPRHALPEAYASLLRQLNERNPLRFFVFENVPGLMGARHRPRYERFKELFRKAGFKIKEACLNAMDYGVPQDRPRVIIVGINETLCPGAEWEIPPQEKTQRTVKDAIWGLKDPEHLNSLAAPEEFAEHPNHWCLVPRSRKFSSKGMLVEGQAWGRSFRTLAWDKPSWTVAYGHREVHVHPNGRRRLSIYEAMLLQSFPPCYRLTGNMSAQIRLVSEAVAPRFAWYVACSIRRSLGI